jgi:ubiquinone/menaquinone biosynthesis C-methylase UbiE
MSFSPEQIQETYYTKTASLYDAMHTSRQVDEHYRALKFIDMVCNSLDLRTLVDVGAGTGRGVRFFLERGKEIKGVEPVKALVRQAELHGVPEGLIAEGTGYCLPFEDNSVDAAFECGVLHHVAEPSRVVSEMMRVSRRAVFLSDSNRFGQGRRAARLLKLVLYKTRIWRIARFIQTRGKMYSISEGDGLGYSYSVFDSYDQLAVWADRLWPISTSIEPSVSSWLHPLVTSPTVLLCAIKDTLE